VVQRSPFVIFQGAAARALLPHFQRELEHIQKPNTLHRALTIASPEKCGESCLFSRDTELLDNININSLRSMWPRPFLRMLVL
jgi:hypothetical protein